MYDILLIPDYSGCIGMETHSTLSSAVAPDYGKTFFRDQEGKVYTMLKKNNTGKFWYIILTL